MKEMGRARGGEGIDDAVDDGGAVIESVAGLVRVAEAHVDDDRLAQRTRCAQAVDQRVAKPGLEADHRPWSGGQPEPDLVRRVEELDRDDVGLWRDAHLAG